MKLIVTRNYEEASTLAANYMAAQILMKPNCVLGLATGSTPLGIYHHLIKMYQDHRITFRSVSSVNLDEYYQLPPDHPQSYHHYMHSEFFNQIDIPADATHLPNALAEDPAQECRRYDRLIDHLGGIDFQLLGIGANGHIAFNEPSDDIPNGTHLVDLTESTIDANKRFFSSASEVPRKAYTMGIGSILRARKILLIATGTNKAQALQETVCGPVTPRVPASLLQLHGDTTILADREAAQLLDERNFHVN